MVPEVSLIMEKPQTRIMNNPSINAMPELKFNGSRDSTFKTSESYASWKEKQYPHQSTNVSSPNHLHRMFSSTQNTSNLQDTHGLKCPVKSSNPMDYK